MYRYLVAILFFAAATALHLPPFFFNLRSLALSPQSHSASRIAQETSARFTAHSF